ASGDEAVKVTKKLKPDVVLLDIRMQGKDGLAARLGRRVAASLLEAGAGPMLERMRQPFA
ncbi:MAG: response regulator, partial [Planctomycetia bacterium]|nr:response regulator [Planctomycetia bacterium]